MLRERLNPGSGIRITAVVAIIAIAAVVGSRSQVGAVVGGNQESTETAPWLVAIAEGQPKGFKCGGVLIDEHWVATAHHCVEGLDPLDIYVVVGLTDPVPPSGVDIPGTNLFQPDASFSAGSCFGSICLPDLALLRLSSPVPSSVATPIELAESPPPPFTQVRAYGWGDGSGAQDAPRSARQVILLPIFGEVISWSLDGRVCSGDSGGPVVDSASGALLGIIARATCGPFGLTGSANIPFLFDWIDETIAANPPPPPPLTETTIAACLDGRWALIDIGDPSPWVQFFGSEQECVDFFQEPVCTGPGNQTPSVLLEPLPGTTLTGSTVTFRWSGGCGLDRYDLWLGDSPETNNLFDASDGTFLEITVTGLPTDGRTIHLRHTSSLHNDPTTESWVQQTNSSRLDLTFTAANLSPAIEDIGCPAGPIPAGEPYQCTPSVSGPGPFTYSWDTAMAGSCPTPTGSCYSAAPPQSLLEAPIFGTANQNPAKIHLEVCNANGCDEAAQDVAIQTRAQCFSEVVSDPPVAVGSSPGEVSLSWDPAGGCTEGYFVYFNDDTNIFAIVGSEPGTTFNPDTESGIFNAGNATSFTVLGLVPGKTYYFWIQSYGEGDGQNPTPGGMATVQAGP